MNASQQTQELESLLWGTRMPIAIMISSQFVQVRARGSCSLTIQDNHRLQSQIPDPASIKSQVSSLIVNTFTDVMGEMSRKIPSTAELNGAKESATQALQAQLQPKLDALGLHLKTITIETIEKV